MRKFFLLTALLLVVVGCEKNNAHFKVISGKVICSNCDLSIGNLSISGEKENNKPFSFCPYCGYRIADSGKE